MMAANPEAKEAFLVAAAGFPMHPVHYPRTEGQVGAEHFELFAESERRETLSLPDLTASDASLPCHPPR